MNHDTKDATYKLALLRALAEISNKHFHEVKWLAGGMVAVPASLVVDCWIRYYWPIFESPTFIPQKNGERPGCAKPVMFRDSMTSLIRTFSGSGSYAEFLSALDSDPSLGKQARTKVLNAIRQGPVVYSSGDLFSWYREGRIPFIKLSGKFWEELAEFSHWIEPAIRLRWAEETARFSKNELQTGEILSILSRDYEAERNVGFSRSVFNDLHGLKCTWTDASIRKFDIDHIIPYSLWHNNGLWNLVPARKQVNIQKRDKLVARDFLFSRREAIIYAWEIQRDRLPDRFDRELVQLLGRPPNPGNWKLPAFDRLSEAIEATAFRRQAERWSA